LEDDEEDEDEEGEELQAGDDDQQDDEQARLAKKRRRRGKRGGRRRARRPVEEPAGADAGTAADLPEAGALMPAADSGHLADVSGAPLSNEESAVDAEDREDGEAGSDGETAEEAAYQVNMLHEAEAAHEVPDEQKPEHEHVEIDAPEIYPEETPGEPELASASAAADEIEPPAHEHQEPESREADHQGGDGQGFEGPAIAAMSEDHGTEDHGAERHVTGDGDSGAAPEPTELDRHQPGHGDPVSDDDRREREPAPEHGGNEHEGGGDKRSVTVNTSRTVVINVGEDDEANAEGGRRGWWQRLLS
jgi:ribonuclease E